MVLGLIPAAILVDKKGIRFAIVTSGVLLTICCLLRCIPSENLSPTQLKYLLIISMIFNGLSSTSLNFSGPLVSSTWFPPSERATATAIGSIAPYIGSSLGFIIGPNFVNQSTADKEILRNDIENLYILEAVVQIIIFLGLLCYFPVRPDIAPSHSEIYKREDKLNFNNNNNGYKGISKLCFEFPKKALMVWNIAFCFSLPTGLFLGWGAVLDLNMESLGFTRDDSSWLGFWMTIGGCFGAIFVGRYVDLFVGRLKTVIIILLSISTLGFFWFSILVHKWIPFSGISK
eukprot:c19307_g1_i3.p1 GENE.c19307_g1_i3~~c19307_g1_i3.p1  ORF type:complete len:288 (-),score=68.11 c19307_g1_i3:101-964(-)